MCILNVEVTGQFLGVSTSPLPCVRGPTPGHPAYTASTFAHGGSRSWVPHYICDHDPAKRCYFPSERLVVHLSCASSVLHSQKAPPNIKRKVEGLKRTQQITSAKLLGKKGGRGPTQLAALFLQGFSPHKLKVTWEGRRHSRQLPGATETELYCQLPLSSGHRLYKTKGHSVVSA